MAWYQRLLVMRVCGVVLGVLGWAVFVRGLAHASDVLSLRMEVQEYETECVALVRVADVSVESGSTTLVALLPVVRKIVPYIVKTARSVLHRIIGCLIDLSIWLNKYSAD